MGDDIMGDDELEYMDDRYTPSNQSIKPGDAVAMVYYSHLRKHYRLHDGVYYGGPPGLKDDGKAKTQGTFYIVHYRMRKDGHMCHELLTGHAGNGYIVKIIKTAAQAYPPDPAYPNQPAPSGTKGCASIIPKGVAVAVKTINDVKNGRLVHATCRNFPDHTGRVQINHFRLTRPEASYKKNNPPPNSEIKGYSHTLSHVSFVETAKLSAKNTCGG